MINGQKIGKIALIFVLVIVGISAIYTSHLVSLLSEEEQRHVQTWAEATHQLILADEDDNIDFYTDIIEQNTTIPVYIVDEDGNILQMRNVSKPVADPRTLQGPIEVRVSDEITQYIYYDDSTIIRKLSTFQYLQLSIIILFVVMAIISLHISVNSEQNRVWVGLSKETAHQLGTPISSLNAWQTLLSAKYPDDELIPQMEDDVKRLQTIAERFSKVGSAPELESADIVTIINNSVSYMRSRMSNKVNLVVLSDDGAQSEFPIINVDVNVPLFSWVLENLIKNAIDAMVDGVGSIIISVSDHDSEAYIDVRDTGRGIDRHKLNTIFQPGYTTKKRGWGLGLSLAKRIIEDYHRGKLFVKESEVGKGTTFRIILKKSKDS